MKHIYLLIEAGREIDPLTNYYYVMVGSSRRDQNALRAISERAKTHNWYFTQMDADTRQFLARIFQSQPNHRPVIKVDAARMLRYILDGSRPAPSAHSLANEARLNYHINIDFRVGHHA